MLYTLPGYTYYGTLKAQTATTTGTRYRASLDCTGSSARPLQAGASQRRNSKFGLASHAFMIFLWEGLYFNVVGTIPLTLVQFIIFWADLPGFSSFQAIFQDSTEM